MHKERRAEILKIATERRNEARQAETQAAAYAAWMRSDEGQRHRGRWIGRPEMADEEAASQREEAQLWDDILEALNSLWERPA